MRNRTLFVFNTASTTNISKSVAHQHDFWLYQFRFNPIYNDKQYKDNVSETNLSAISLQHFFSVIEKLKCVIKY